MFEVIRSTDMKRTAAVALPDPAMFPVEGHPGERHKLYTLAIMIALALLLSTIIGGYKLIHAPLGLSPVQINLILAAFCSINLLLITGVISTMFDSGTRYMAAIVISVFTMVFLVLARTLLMEQYALALAILFGVMVLLNVILAYVAYSDKEHKWMAFAITVAVIMLGLTIAFGMKVKKQGDAVSADTVTRVQTVQQGHRRMSSSSKADERTLRKTCLPAGRLINHYTEER